MSHKFETGFFVEEPAWHGLGVLLQEPPATGKLARSMAGLDWKVFSDPVYVRGQHVPGFKAVIRETDGQVLGIHSDAYQAESPADFLSLTDSFVQSGNLIHESAGSLDHGRQYWNLLKIPDATYSLAGRDTDRANPHLLLTSGFTGAEAREVFKTHVRVVCWNTLSLARASSRPLAQRKHKGSWYEASRALTMAIKEAIGDTKEMQTRVQFLADSPMSADEFARFCAELFSLPTEPKALERSRTASALNRSWTEFPELGNTRWRAHNAVTALLDRGLTGRTGSMQRVAFNKANSALRNKAWSLLLA